MSPAHSVGTVHGVGFLIWSPTPTRQVCDDCPHFPHKNQAGPRKVGKLAESLSLESQELAARYWSVLKPACPVSIQVLLGETVGG